jgi:hypothetical protein
MRLLSLALSNFKGIKSFEFKPNGSDACVVADNSVGKTTLADSEFWLLTGKDSLGAAEFGIKTLDKDNQPLHNLEHCVEGVYDVDGRTLTLKKVYKEVWERKKGEATKTFTKHTTDYFVNGVPVQKLEFDRQVENVCSAKRFQELTDPAHVISRMKWEDRRRLLLEICGDVSESDVISSSRALSPIRNFLEDRSIDDYRKIAKGTKDKINGELKEIPVRIAECDRGMADIPAGNYEADAETLAAAIADLESQKANLSSGGAVAEARNKFLELQGKMHARANELQSGGVNPARTEALSRQQQLTQEVKLAEIELNVLEASARNLERQVADMDAVRERTKAAVAAEREKEFGGETACPTCGQDLPAENVEEARARFNLAKADTLEKMLAAGKTYREERDAVAATLATKTTEIETVKISLEKLRTDLDAVVIPEESYVHPSDDAEYQRLTTAKAEAQKVVTGLQENSAAAAATLDEDLTKKRSLHRATLSTIEAVNRNKQSIDRKLELADREKELAEEFEVIEGQLFLLDEFLRQKVKLLTDRINSKFALVRWKLFNELVNGGIEECCIATVGGVPYGQGLNNAACINAGLDVINVLGAHYGFSPPIFIDGAESVTDVLPTRAQQIRLVVAPWPKPEEGVPFVPRPTDRGKELAARITFASKSTQPAGEKKPAPTVIQTEQQAQEALL